MGKGALKGRDDMQADELNTGNGKTEKVRKERAAIIQTT